MHSCNIHLRVKILSKVSHTVNSHKKFNRKLKTFAKLHQQARASDPSPTITNLTSSSSTPSAPHACERVCVGDAGARARDKRL